MHLNSSTLKIPSKKKLIKAYMLVHLSIKVHVYSQIFQGIEFYTHFTPLNWICTSIAAVKGYITAA